MGSLIERRQDEITCSCRVVDSLDGNRRRVRDRAGGIRRHRNERTSRRPHGMVARGPLRHVHPLGRLQRPRRRLPRQANRRHGRMDHEQRLNPGGRIRRLRQAVQPGEIRRGPMGEHREERRHEVHRHHREAPRRLRDVQVAGQPIQHRRRHAFSSRSAEGIGRGLPETGDQAGLLLFPGAGLASSGRGA